jgi:hypothetical protein
MSDDRAAEIHAAVETIKQRWYSDELHRAEWWADHASRDIPFLIGEVERLQSWVDGQRESIQEWRANALRAGEQAQRAVGLEAATSSAFAEVERLRGRLRELEWAGTHCDRDRETAACPVCDVVADSPVFGQQPHLPDCWLAAELGREER